MDHEAWREGARRIDVDYERLPEARIWDELLREAARPTGCTLVTGEPGAGKSTLLERWLGAWVGTGPTPRLGALVPVLVRLRDLPRGEAEALVQESSDHLADRLWQLRLPPAPTTRDAIEPFHGRTTGRLWQPLWLLDGLDELPSSLLGERFLRLLAGLPGRVCLTCRTAVAQSLGQVFSPCIASNASYELMPFTDPEQGVYLEQCFRGDVARAGKLHGRVRGNAQLREIAGNPLLLDLIAEVGEEAELPTSRAEFYRRAIESLWSRRLKADTADRLRFYRDRVLIHLAAQADLAKIILPIEWLDAALSDMPATDQSELRRALDRSGLLRVDRARGRVEFLHLTFQEYFLARHLSGNPLAQAIRRFWSSSRHEETLALLIAQAEGEGRIAEADTALQELIAFGQKLHRHDPPTLWRLGRSPMRTALHLLARAGIELERLATTAAIVHRALRRSPLLRQAVTVDPSSPPALLAWLAPDYAELRRRLARHPAASRDLLAKLARDNDAYVRWDVAANPAAPPDLLTRLAGDDDARVRKGVAGNPATPPDLLARLAKDNDNDVREAMARNPTAPPELLDRLAEDDDAYLHRGMARNPAAPPELLARLARGNKDNVRWYSARKRATLADVLARVAWDHDYAMRVNMAMNPATPPDLLARLARDHDHPVREAVARNRATPPDLLACLSRDDDEDVRRSVAWNPAAPPELLARVVEDDDEDVRAATAQNPATPPELLARLAEDDDDDVRLYVAENPATPADVVSRLADDKNVFVRRSVAWNPAAPPDLLARLAGDDDDEVRRAMAGNPAAPPELLARLARYNDVGLHLELAGNPAALFEDLAAIA